MTKVVFRKRNPKRDKRVLAIRRKKFRTASGKIATVPTLDAEDPDFGLKLEAAFRRNVAKITREIKNGSRATRRASAMN